MRPVASVLLLAAALAAPHLGLSAYVLTLLGLCVLNAIQAVGFSILFGMTGILSLAHAGFVGVGAYTAAVLSTDHDLSPWLAIPAGAAVACLSGMALSVLALRLRSHYLVLATIAFSEIAHQVFVNWDSVTHGSQGVVGVPPAVLSLMGRSIDFSRPGNFLLLAVLALLAVIFAVERMSRSRIGRGLSAVRDDELAAGALGIAPTPLKVLAFAMSACVAGLAGGLYAGFYGFVSPESFSFESSALVLAMVVIGGKRSVPGAVIGAAFLTWLPEALRQFQDWYPTVFGTIILLTLIFLPDGLVTLRHPGQLRLPRGLLRQGALRRGR